MPTVRTDVEIAPCNAGDIAAILTSFSDAESTGKQSLQQMLSANPASFSRSSVPVLAASTPDAAARYLVQLLWKQQLLVEELVNPARNKTEDALGAAQTVTRLGTPIEKELERALGFALGQAQSAALIARIVRILDLLGAISAPRPCLLFQGELMAHRSSAVRARAALQIARSGKNSGLIARLLLDPDAEVQAAVVEAMWSLGADEARPLLQTAAKSKQSRVAGNAAVGLYRLGDVSSVRLMHEMARQPDPGFLETAIWAMGEAADSRFLPFLMEQFQRSVGPERMAVLRALGCIRRKEREQMKADPIEVRISETHTGEGSRRLAVTLRSPGNQDLSFMKGTSFAISEGGVLIEDYSVAAPLNPALLIAAFVLPRFESASDPYRTAILEGMNLALRFRRPDDLWRIDRYLLEKPSLKGAAPAEKSTLPYDEAFLGSTKTVRGFLTSPDLLGKAISEPGPPEKSAGDVAHAIDRVVNAMRRIAGTRHLFVFLHSGGGNLVDGRRMEELHKFVREESLVLHGIAPQDAKECEALRDLCLAIEGGSFRFAPPEGVPQIVERIYSNLLNCFEVTYGAPDSGSATEGAVLISDDRGCGRAEFSFVG